MYGIPKDFDASFFVGRTLEQVCFSANQVSFHFDADVDVIVESAFRHIQPERPAESQPVTVPPSESSVMRLLEHKVVTATTSGGSTLSLTFDQGHILECLDNSRYESYHIRRGPYTVTV